MCQTQGWDEDTETQYGFLCGAPTIDHLNLKKKKEGSVLLLALGMVWVTVINVLKLNSMI